ncbi:hypothetical protein I6G82_11770 [Lysinibacillus macroides]|uniref:Uncharacterized protein n=1 Tax=Lysinibacillus macroides TaxID=33935 RepID=A0A0N0CWH2_9BACI|nr:hypothetical protein [Lysinibacillus macroides]KOY82967.1 hypothetical protein ADM90_06505 [Lysinibacillus macroides]QPR70185.1 hypothetical protein I6G82_11770 [Lysinibacillus macroides]
MKNNIPFIKIFLTSLYAKPKQPMIQVLLVLAIIYIAIQYTVLNLMIYFIASPEEFLFYTILLSNAITYILIAYFAISVVFSQKDFFILAQLPIPTERIVMSKIVSGVAFPIIAVSILSIPTFILLLIEFKLGIAIKSIFFMVVINGLITLCLLFILSILNHVRTAFIQPSVYLLARMMVMLAIGTSPVIYFIAKEYRAISMILEDFDSSTISDFLGLGYRFAMQQPLVELFYPWYSLQSFLLLFVLCLLLFKATIKIIASKYYEHGLLVSSVEKTAKVWKWGSKGTWGNYLQHEYWIIQVEPYFKMHAILGMILTPICTIIFLTIFQMNILQADWLAHFESYLFAYMVLLLSCTNNISGTPYSREGKYYASSITLPFDPQKIYRAKVMISTCISTIAVVISYIIYTLFGKGDITTILLLLITVLLVIAYNILSPLYDRKHPLLDWTNPSEAIKSNPTVLISLVYGLPLLLIIALLHVSLLIFDISPLMATVIILIVVIIFIYKLFNSTIMKGYVDH